MLPDHPLSLGLKKLFSRQPSSFAGDAEAELGQARVRLVVWVIVVLYVGLVCLIDPEGSAETDWVVTVLAIFAVHFVFACGIFWSVKEHPGHYPARRLLGMFADGLALTLVIIVKLSVMLPVFAIMVWTAVGHGMRYGRSYLYPASAISQLGLLAVYLYSDVSIKQWHVMITLSLTALLVPVYAFLNLQRIENARRETADAVESKLRFLAHASHDLRQPLHATSLLIGNLRTRGLTKDQGALVDRIERSLSGVSSLFRSLLEISRLESGRTEVRETGVILNSLLDDVIVDQIENAESNNVKIVKVNTSVVVWTDPILLRSIIQNFLSNAIKFSNGGRVLVGVRVRNGGASVEVWDQGIGIAEEMQSVVFDEFFQVRPSRGKDLQGVGLGLAIARRMAVLLNLSISIRSAEGKGTRISVDGLRVCPDLSPAQIRSIERPSALPVSPMSGFRVALVEDDEDTLHAMWQLMVNWGCEVDAYSAAPADFRPVYDLLITDFDLGGGADGGDCIARYRSVHGQLAPALLITGHDNDGIADLVASKSVIIVQKPINPAELRSLMNTIRIDRSPASSRVQ